jgi:DNA-binding transcriptional MocR family regulator
MPPAASPSAAAPAFRYVGLADSIEAQIRSGVYRAGEKLPSIRRWRASTGLSITTVYQAMIELEKRGLVDSRPKSGYVIQPLMTPLLPLPDFKQPRIQPRKVTINSLAFTIMEAMGRPDVLQLGGSVITPELLPGKALIQGLRATSSRELQRMLASYEHPMGHAVLRRQIAQRAMTSGLSLSPDEVMITNGCFEAVAICLKAVANPGDTVVVESPTFPWYLQLIEDAGMFALEVPADPQAGTDLRALEHVLRRHRVNACIFNANFQNPLGFVASEAHKRELVRLVTERGIALIEDDIYGELYFDRSRPSALKVFDTRGLVLHCASFSKTLAPGVRVGWTMPGRFLERVKRLKLHTCIASPSLTQHLVSRYLRGGGFDRHLRRLRTALHNHMTTMTLAIARHFPAETKISAPRGGLTLWVQLPGAVDSLELFRRALEANIAVLPGVICSNDRMYQDCVRLSYGQPWSAAIDEGLRKLAALARELAGSESPTA